MRKKDTLKRNHIHLSNIKAYYMDVVKERVKSVLTKEKCSVSRLAGGHSSGRQVKFNTQINGEARMTVEVLCEVARMFPNISAEWLLRGEGQMYKSQTQGNVVNVDTMSGGRVYGGDDNHKECADARTYERAIKEKDARIAELSRDKQILQQMVSMLQGANKLGDCSL